MSHILFISHARGLHGAESVMMQAVKACVKKGARVTVVVPSVVPDAGMKEELKKIEGVRVMALPYRAAGIHKWRTWAVMGYNWYTLCRLARFVRREQVTTIYSSSSITILGAALAQRTGVRHIWHFHEPVDERFGWHPSLKKLYVPFIRQADTIICISHKQQQEWEQALGIQLSNARIIYNPMKRICPMKSKESVHDDGCTIGFVGHFEERKNIPLLVHTFERIYQRFPTSRLLLCGALDEKDRWYVEKLTDLRTPVVEILPQTPDVVKFYGRIDILVLPSWRETMPLVVLEAMQAGVCVLQTNQSGMNELLEDAKETLFFSPDKPEKLLALLVRCMENDYRCSIARAGQEKAMKLVKNQSFDEQIQQLLCV